MDSLAQKITRTEFQKFLSTKQGFSFGEATKITEAMGWKEDTSKNFFQILTRMGKAIARPEAK